ncbi:MAG: YdcF family protein [Oscillospiraceae bacterium]
MQNDFIKAISDFIFINDTPTTVDAIFIPGCEYPQGGELAAELYKKSLAKIIIPSGKYAISQPSFNSVKAKQDLYNKKYLTEAEFLTDVMIKNGVLESAIFQEPNAQNTYENSLFTKKIVTQNNLNINSAIICCKPQHARRCFMYYQLAFPKTKLLVCCYTASGLTVNNWYKNDVYIQYVLGEVRRIGEQFSQNTATCGSDSPLLSQIEQLGYSN